MREIKFRAWDKKEKRMWLDVQNAYDTLGKHGRIEGADDTFYPSSFGSVLDDDNLIVMQYTGLKDKNGVNIWEGDVIKYQNTFILEVRFSSGGFHAGTVEGGRMELCEVLGNVHEHPHLLKESYQGDGVMEQRELPDDWRYCRMCRHSISGSGGFYGKELHGANYCYTCYPKAVDVYLAEQRLLDYKRTIG